MSGVGCSCLDEADVLLFERRHRYLRFKNFETTAKNEIKRESSVQQTTTFTSNSNPSRHFAERHAKSCALVVVRWSQTSSCRTETTRDEESDVKMKASDKTLSNNTYTPNVTDQPHWSPTWREALASCLYQITSYEKWLSLMTCACVEFTAPCKKRFWGRYRDRASPRQTGAEATRRLHGLPRTQGKVVVSYCRYLRLRFASRRWVGRTNWCSARSILNSSIVGRSARAGFVLIDLRFVPEGRSLRGLCWPTDSTIDIPIDVACYNPMATGEEDAVIQRLLSEHFVWNKKMVSKIVTISRKEPRLYVIHLRATREHAAKGFYLR
jgi:hypothetical protein